jgi:hypothetical protein
MTLISRIFIVFFVLNLISPSSYAISIVDNVCDERAVLGEWQAGIANKQKMKDVIHEFDTEGKRDFVRRLDSLPVKINENSIIEKIGQSPTQRISIFADSPQLNWDLSNSDNHLYVSVQMYKGCVSRIGLFDSQKQKFFSRYNVLPTVTGKEAAPAIH